MIIRKFRFEVLAIILLSVLTTIAQENRCNLKLRVVEFEDEIPLIEAEVKILNLKTKEFFDNKGQVNEEFVFLNLPESDYEITAKKENFKQSIEKFALNCKSLNSKDYHRRWVNLQAGDSKEKVEIDHRNNKLPKFASTDQSVESQAIDEEVIKQRQKERREKFAKLNNILNGQASYLERAEFPRAAKAVRASGIVYVRIIINEKGEIESAQAVSGHPLLRAAAVKAAEKAKFDSTATAEKTMKTNGLLIYNFVL